MRGSSSRTLSLLAAFSTWTLQTQITPIFAGSNEISAAFLEENAKKEGVIVLPSGLQYKILRNGTGEYHPTIDSPCECHYEGTLIDGTKFDSSYDRGSPTTFAPNQVIKGWTEAMQLMVEGDKWEMYIPSDLGYGDRGSPPKIGGGDALIFQMEILKIKGGKVPAVICDPTTLEGCNDREKAYIEKINKKFGGDVDAIEVEVERIDKVSVSVESEELLEWADRRKRILEKLIEKGGKEDEGERDEL